MTEQVTDTDLSEQGVDASGAEESGPPPSAALPVEARAEASPGRGKGLSAPSAIRKETVDQITAQQERDHLSGLIEKIAEARCKEAFADLFNHFAPRVKGYLMRLGADNGQAEELAQEVLLTVWRKAEMFDRRQASAGTWIFTIARNRRIDLLRRRKALDIDPDDPAILPGAEPTPDEAMQAVQREERLHEAMKDLPQEQFELLQKAFFQGQTHREIADETGLPLGTVKSRLRLAFTRLRRALDGSV